MYYIYIQIHTHYDIIDHYSTSQKNECIGLDVLCYDKNKLRDGKIVDFYMSKNATVRGQHIIEFKDDKSRILISLKTAVSDKKAFIISGERTLKNIQHINNYLPLYLSSESPRNKCWKPTYYNDNESKILYNQRDKLEFQGTYRSIRTDWILEQKFAHADCKNGEFEGYIRMMIGSCYQLYNNNKIICVTDVKSSRGTQFISYIEVYQFS